MHRQLNGYTKAIAYSSFFLPDGRRMDGETRKISDAVYLKADGKTIGLVRYFSFFPYINALEREVRLNPGHFVIIGT